MLDSEPVEIQKNNPKIPFIAIFLIAICWVCALANQSYFQGIFEVSEAREGVVVNEIKEYGTWILPLRNGEVVPSKPPLFHWATAVFSLGLDNLDEFFLRVVSLLSAIFSVFAFYLFLKSDLKKKAAPSGIPIVASLIYATTYGFIQMSVDGRVDMTFNLFFLVSILTLNHFLINDKLPTFRHKVVLSIIIGLGVLARGPLAIVLFFLSLGIGLIALGKLKDLKKWIFNDYFAIIVGPLLISGPWYLASKFLGKPELINRQLVFENISRFFGSDKIPSKPFWFYFEHIWLQSFPWSFVLLFLIAYLIKSKKTFSANDTLRRYLKLYGSQALVIFIFFSISSGKRNAYLLSVLPFFAVIVGVLYYRVLETSKFTKLNSNKFGVVSLFLIALSLLTILLKCVLFIGVPSFLDYSFFQGLFHLPLSSLLLPFLITGCLYFVLKKYKDNPHWLVLTIACLAIQSYIAMPGFFYLTKGESHSYKYFVKDVQKLLQPEDELKVIKLKDDESFDSFLFYYGKRIPIVSPNGSIEPGTYLAKKEWLESQPLTLQDQAIVLTRGKRLADKDKRNLVLFKFH